MVRKTQVVLLKLGSLLGLFPWIDFEKHYAVNKKVHTVFPAIIMGIIMVNYCISLIWQIEHNFFDNTLFVETFSTLLVIFNSCYFKRTEWKQFFQTYWVTESLMENELHEVLDVGLKYHIFFIFYLCCLITKRTISTYQNLLHDFFVDFVQVIRLMTDFVPILLLSILTKGFKAVNKYPKQLVKDDRSDLTESNDNGLNTDLCKKMYMHLYCLSYYTQNIFGWIITYNIFTYIIIFISCVQYYIVLLYVGQMQTTLIGLVFATLYRLVSNFLLPYIYI